MSRAEQHSQIFSFLPLKLRAMSALPPKADILRCTRHVRFVPIADGAAILCVCVAPLECNIVAFDIAQSRIPDRSASANGCGADSVTSTPTSGIFPTCCARAASGHIAATLPIPIRLINSRRLMADPGTMSRTGQAHHWKGFGLPLWVKSGHVQRTRRCPLCARSESLSQCWLGEDFRVARLQLESLNARFCG